MEWRVALEARGLGPISIKVRINAVRKLAVASEAAAGSALAYGIFRLFRKRKLAHGNNGSDATSWRGFPVFSSLSDASVGAGPIPRARSPDQYVRRRLRPIAIKFEAVEGAGASSLHFHRLDGGEFQPVEFR